MEVRERAVLSRMSKTLVTFDKMPGALVPSWIVKSRHGSPPIKERGRQGERSASMWYSVHTDIVRVVRCYSGSLPQGTQG